LPPTSTLFPYTTLFRSRRAKVIFSRYNMSKHKTRRHGFVHRHSLSLTAIGILILWTVLYIYADPTTHLGSFYGNAIADWSGMVVDRKSTRLNSSHDQIS